MTPNPPEEQTPTNERVLLVDDEPDVVAALADALNAYLPDLEVKTAASGQEALEVLANHHIHAIVTDYRMPGMDGLEFLREARKVAPNAPRIMITAFPDLDLAVRALNQENIENFITKPLRTQRFVSAVSAVLEEHRMTIARNQELVQTLRERQRARGGLPQGA